MTLPRLKNTLARIKEVLRENHHLAETEEDDFKLTSPEEITKMVKSTLKTMNVLLWSVGVLSLLVGGIVLMNIMLMAVSERKKEIGLRRAVGAKKKHIVIQFLSESLLLTFAGGFFGAGTCGKEDGLRHTGRGRGPEIARRRG